MGEGDSPWPSTFFHRKTDPTGARGRPRVLGCGAPQPSAAYVSGWPLSGLIVQTLGSAVMYFPFGLALAPVCGCKLRFRFKSQEMILCWLMLLQAAHLAPPQAGLPSSRLAVQQVAGMLTTTVMPAALQSCAILALHLSVCGAAPVCMGLLFGAAMMASGPCKT